MDPHKPPKVKVLIFGAVLVAVGATYVALKLRTSQARIAHAEERALKAGLLLTPSALGWGIGSDSLPKNAQRQYDSIRRKEGWSKLESPKRLADLKAFLRDLPGAKIPSAVPVEIVDALIDLQDLPQYRFPYDWLFDCSDAYKSVGDTALIASAEALRLAIRGDRSHAVPLMKAAATIAGYASQGALAESIGVANPAEEAVILAAGRVAHIIEKPIRPVFLNEILEIMGPDPRPQTLLSGELVRSRFRVQGIYGSGLSSLRKSWGSTARLTGWFAGCAFTLSDDSTGPVVLDEFTKLDEKLRSDPELAGIELPQLKQAAKSLSMVRARRAFLRWAARPDSGRPLEPFSNRTATMSVSGTRRVVKSLDGTIIVRVPS